MNSSFPSNFTQLGDFLYFGASELPGRRRPRRCRGVAFEAPPPAADTSVAITIKGKKLKLSKKGVASAKLECPASEVSPPCEGTLAIKTQKKVPFKGKRRKVALDKPEFSIGAGATEKVEPSLDRNELKLVREEPKARKVKATAKVRDQAGNEGRATKKMKLVP
jgi:hypothetical protein